MVNLLSNSKRIVQIRLPIFFGNDQQTFDQLSAIFRQFKNWMNWIASTSDFDERRNLSKSIINGETDETLRNYNKTIVKIWRN